MTSGEHAYLKTCATKLLTVLLTKSLIKILVPRVQVALYFLGVGTSR